MPGEVAEIIKDVRERLQARTSELRERIKTRIEDIRGRVKEIRKSLAGGRSQGSSIIERVRSRIDEWVEVFPRLREARERIRRRSAPRTTSRVRVAVRPTTPTPTPPPVRREKEVIQY